MSEREQALNEASNVARQINDGHEWRVTRAIDALHTQSIEQQTCDHIIGFDLDEHLHRASNRPTVDPQILFNYCPNCGARIECL